MCSVCFQCQNKIPLRTAWLAGGVERAAVRQRETWLSRPADLPRWSCFDDYKLRPAGDLREEQQTTRARTSEGETASESSSQRITEACSSKVHRSERNAMQKAFQKKKEEEIKASEERKTRMSKIDHRKNPVLTRLELKKQERDKRVVERAAALKMEEEDEIKQLNQLIGEAHCQAARDVQLQEHRRLQKEQAEGERRVHEMLKVERQKALDAADKMDEKRKQQRIRGRNEIQEQIQQNLVKKQAEKEVKKEEGKQLREQQEQMDLEDLRALEKKREETKLLQDEIKRINAESIDAKKQRKQQEKLADRTEAEYNKKKMQQEAEHEAEQRRIKKEREAEIKRLGAQQKRAADQKAKQEELHTRRIKEAKDREWRRAEVQRAVKKVEDRAVMEKSRLKQIQDKGLSMSKEVGRQKAQFDRDLRVLRQRVAKDQEQQERKQQDARRHLQAVQQQMQEEKLSAAEKRRELLKETDRQQEKAQLKQKQIQDLKEKKLKDLRATRVPEKHCQLVERRTKNQSAND
uniref:Cilia- and flagella-associated protein 45 n=1 Tax=Salarias fasciatus TaxID=181472 RepID=A0A672IQ82_SALFA